MQIQLPYAGQQVAFELPLPADQVTLLQAPDPTPTAALEQVVDEALAAPLGRPRLAEMVRPGARVAVLFDDFTRPTPIAGMMPPVLEELRRGGVRDDDVLLVCANGMHAPDYMGRERLTEKLDPELVERYRVLSHDAYDDAQLQFVGVTRCLGTPLWINRHVLEADVRVALGRIAPHGEVGYSGGAKAILPGVASVWSIIHHHSGSAPRPGVLDNLLREDIDEAGQLAGLDFILNAVYNSRHQVLKAFAGDPIQAHRAGVAYGDQQVWGALLAEPSELLILSPGVRGEGYFSSAIGCLRAVPACLKPEGSVVVVASGRQGWAEASLVESGWTVGRDILQHDYPELLRWVAARAWHEPYRQFQALVYWVQNVVRTCHERRVVLAGFEGFCRAELAKVNVELWHDVDAALVAAVDRTNGEMRAVVVPDRFTLPLRLSPR